MDAVAIYHNGKEFNTHFFSFTTDKTFSEQIVEIVSHICDLSPNNSVFSITLICGERENDMFTWIDNNFDEKRLQKDAQNQTLET